MEFVPTEIPDVMEIRPRVFSDRRGVFFESWNARTFAQAGLDLDFVQDNHCDSGVNVLRGIHYQIEKPQGKLVRVTSGTVFDVAVDLRLSSRTFGKWVGMILSEQKRNMLWIPPGFAHGYLVTSTSAQLLYKCTDFYAPEHERAVRWDDPDLKIEWPLPAGIDPIVSKKDAAALSFRDAEKYS
ncbi:MAG: dTDP-4-dehydrorhamnose 3,5-epimerase [Desulfovibrionales bacterium]